MNLIVFDLDVILNAQKIELFSKFENLEETQIIMFAASSGFIKTEIDDLGLFYHYFYQKDISCLFTKNDYLIEGITLIDAIDSVLYLEQFEDSDVSIMGRNLEIIGNDYEIFDLDDDFTDFYEDSNQVEKVVKQLTYKKN